MRLPELLAKAVCVERGPLGRISYTGGSQDFRAVESIMVVVERALQPL